MSRRSLETRLEALEAQNGPPLSFDAEQVQLFLSEVSMAFLDQYEAFVEPIAAATPKGQELVFTVDQEIEFQAMLTLEAPDEATLARWKTMLGITSTQDGAIDHEIDHQVRQLIASRAVRGEVIP
jgi:hypothetical protein